MERKINERFRYENLLLRVRTAPKPCLGCHFNAGPGKSDCLERDRTVTGECTGRGDGATVVFLRLGRIGERPAVKVAAFAAKVAYFPLFILGRLLLLAGGLLLSAGYLLALDPTKSANVAKSLVNRYNYERKWHRRWRKGHRKND